MKLIFWLSFALIAYVYVGYALWLWLCTHLRKFPVLQKAADLDVSIIIAARNEEANLPAKLQNLGQLQYPRDRLQIVVVSDGSTDQTAGILQAHRAEICPVLLAQSMGKACALNEGVKRATGEIVVFLDTRQIIEADSITQLVSCFADPQVGAASGELLLHSTHGSASSGGLGIYWHIEKIVRKLESQTGSVVGATGAIYAIRREYYRELPAGTLLDDVLVPMQVARLGKRVVFQPLAIARDQLFSAKGKEFSRKVRTLTGNYQLLRLQPWLLSAANPLLFRFVSHKLLRLVVPLFLVIMLLASALSRGPFYATAFWLQLLFYALAAVGVLVPSTGKYKPVSVANAFVMLNAAAAVAFYNFVAGRKGVWA
jgi:cellulose synthase/poly-beta-1,6-N-acetylglucosamine synthase-like glycosyltransferase